MISLTLNHKIKFFKLYQFKITHIIVYILIGFFVVFLLPDFFFFFAFDFDEAVVVKAPGTLFIMSRSLAFGFPRKYLGAVHHC